METHVLLSIVVSTAIEETIVDWLLEQEMISGFSSMSINGHGSSLHSLSIYEQVTGRKKQVLFQMHMPAEHVQSVINALKQQFQGSGIHYWVVPVLNAGRLSEEPL